MTKIQLKRIYSKIFSYNRNEVREYNSLEEMAKNLESKYTLKHKEINDIRVKINTLNLSFFIFKNIYKKSVDKKQNIWYYIL